MARNTLIMLLLPVLWVAFSAMDRGGDPWKAPAQADQLKDPMAGNPKAVQRGEKVFTALCWVCHGMAGQGDGPTAASLQVKPASLMGVSMTRCSPKWSMKPSVTLNAPP